MTQSIDVGRLLDEGRWGTYARWLVFLTSLTIIFDGVDIQLLGVAIPAIMKDWGLARAAFAPVVSFGFVGMLIGGAASGLAGDRLGRRVALLSSMFVFGVMTMAFASAHSVTSLVVFRLCAGLGLGGAIPNATALAAEYVPVPQRPFAVTLAIVCVPLGATLAGLIALHLLPALGWRAFFVVGGALPVATAAVLIALLPESPRFLAAHPPRWPELARILRRMGHDVDPSASFAERADAARSNVSAGVVLSSAYIVDTLALWGAFFSSLLGVYLVFNWLPTVLTGAGLGSVASTGITVFNLGGVVGALIGGRSIRRLGSRGPILLMAALSVAGALAMSAMAFTSTSVISHIIIMLALTGGFINATQTMMYALAAHVYPTMARATGVGAAMSVGRAGAILSGYAGPWALEFNGTASFFQLVAIAMLLSLVCLAVIRRHVGAEANRALKI